MILASAASSCEPALWSETCALSAAARSTAGSMTVNPAASSRMARVSARMRGASEELELLSNGTTQT